MGNSESTLPTKRGPSLLESGDDLNYLARIKRAQDARKEAIAANVHDNVKVIDRYVICNGFAVCCTLYFLTLWHCVADLQICTSISISTF